MVRKETSKVCQSNTTAQTCRYFVHNFMQGDHGSDGGGSSSSSSAGRNLLNKPSTCLLSTCLSLKREGNIVIVNACPQDILVFLQRYLKLLRNHYCKNVG